MKKIILVTAWDRSSWLAYKLKQNGAPLSVWDLSSFLDLASSVEREGPFGIFLPSHLEEDQKQILSGENIYSVSQGFSIWDRTRPLELKGHLSEFSLDQRQNLRLYQKALAALLKKKTGSFFSDLRNSQFFSKKKTVEEHLQTISSLFALSVDMCSSYVHHKPYLKTNFTGNISFTKYFLKSKKHFSNDSHYSFFSPFFADYIIRENSQKYFDFLSEKEERKTVVKKDVEFLFQSLKKDKSLKVIWALSGPETKSLFPNLMPILFPRWEEPSYTWKNFSLKWNWEYFQNIVPNFLAVLPEGSFQYTEKNSLMILKKTPHSHYTDLWILCPYKHRFNKKFLIHLLEEALISLKNIFPDFAIKNQPLKIKPCHDYFNVYGESSKKTYSSFFKAHNNTIHLNPESTGRSDMYSMLCQSEYILKNIFFSENYSSS